MIKVTVLNKAGQIGWMASFQDQAQVDAWVSAQVQANSWGRAERWIRLENAENEDIEEAIDTREYELSPAMPIQYDPETGEITFEGRDPIMGTEYLMPAEYTIQTEDTTAQEAQAQLVRDGQLRQELGANVIAKVYSINESKNITPEVFAAMIADATLERIERMLWTGSLRTAKLMIQSLDTTYFTAQEKAEIVAMIDNSGLI